MEEKNRTNILASVLQRPRVVHGDLVTWLREMLSVAGADDLLVNTHFADDNKNGLELFRIVQI